MDMANKTLSFFYIRYCSIFLSIRKSSFSCYTLQWLKCTLQVDCHKNAISKQNFPISAIGALLSTRPVWNLIHHQCNYPRIQLVWKPWMFAKETEMRHCACLGCYPCMHPVDSQPFNGVVKLKWGDEVATWLECSTPDRVIRVRVLAEDILLTRCLSPPRCINGYRPI